MLLGGIWLQIIVLKAFHNASPLKAPYQCWHGFSNYSEKLWTVPFGNIIVSLVYSFSVEAISNFNPNLSHNFLDRYSPIPVAFALFLLEPVKPFSNTRDKSDVFIPQPLSSITSSIFVPLSWLYIVSLFSCLSKYLIAYLTKDL